MSNVAQGEFLPDRRSSIEGYIGRRFAVHIHSRIEVLLPDHTEGADFQTYEFCVSAECPERLTLNGLMGDDPARRDIHMVGSPRAQERCLNSAVLVAVPQFIECPDPFISGVLPAVVRLKVLKAGQESLVDQPQCPSVQDLLVSRRVFRDRKLDSTPLVPRWDPGEDLGRLDIAVLNREFPDQVIESAAQAVHHVADPNADFSSGVRGNRIQMEGNLHDGDVGHDASMDLLDCSNQMTREESTALKTIFRDQAPLDTFVVSLSPNVIGLRVIGLNERLDVFAESVNVVLRPVELGVGVLQGSLS